MSYILTVDLGTSYFKVAVFDEGLQRVAGLSMAVPSVAPQPGRCELSVGDFVRCLDAAVREVRRNCGGLQEVTKISFASQANSFSLFDSDDDPLLPLLLWPDQRAGDLGSFLSEFASDGDFYTTTGVARLDSQFMVAKLHWLQINAPQIFERSRRLRTISDYFLWWLTGNNLAEASLMGLTGLIDIHRLEYRRAALERLQLPSDWLPTLVRAGSDAGPVRPEIARQWGLGRNCRLVVGCLDQYAGAIGAGAGSPGGICETTGTVLATVRCASGFNPRLRQDVFQGPAPEPGVYFQMVFSSLSAGILERYRNSLPDRPSFEELDRLAEKVPPGVDGLQFNRRAIQDEAIDMFVGRTDAHQRGHEVRAILEAVAKELRDQVATLCGNDWPTSLKACGGAARSRLWRQIKREIVGCPVEPIDAAEPTCLGAARVANGVPLG